MNTCENTHKADPDIMGPVKDVKKHKNKDTTY
jgi:hypothetical protein